jgi:hypothetical protein
MHALLFQFAGSVFGIRLADSTGLDCDADERPCVETAERWSTERKCFMYKNDPALLTRLGRWMKEQVVQQVPDDLAQCEYHCRKSQCRLDEWQSCEKRLTGSRLRKQVAWPACKT